MNTLKQQNYSFLGMDIVAKEEANKNNAVRAFDWDRAAVIIKQAFKDHPDLVAEAGLQGDWQYTGGVIFEEGQPYTESYTYLASTWATPTLILSWDGKEQEEYECYTGRSDRFDSHTKWDSGSLAILNG